MHFAHNPLTSSLNAEPIKAKPCRGRFQDRVTNYGWYAVSDSKYLRAFFFSLQNIKFSLKQKNKDLS